MAQKVVSLVVPVFNEEEMVAANLQAILSAAEGESYILELIVVDDGSKDGTLKQVEQLQGEEPRIKLVSFTRNFGKEAAVYAGLEAASGACSIVLDSDLQHPPQLIPRMIALWQEGFHVVEGVKSNRGEEKKSNRFFANLFYNLFFKSTGLDLKNHSDFKLLDRRVIQEYLKLPEKERFFRGLIQWLNYPTATLPFEVADRVGGQSQWSQIKLAKYAINNITSFSSLPLRLIGVVGALTLFLGVVVGVISLMQKLFGQALDGFTTVNLLIIIMGGAILFSLGILGHYISKIYNELKCRPFYIAKSKEHHAEKGAHHESH